MALTGAAQFSFLKPALVQQCLLLLGGEASGIAPLVSLTLVPRHHRFETVDFIGHLLMLFGQSPTHVGQFGRLLQAFHLMVDGSDLCLTLFEFAMRVQQVINRWHKVTVSDTTSQIARECATSTPSILPAPNSSAQSVREAT